MLIKIMLKTNKEDSTMFDYENDILESALDDILGLDSFDESEEVVIDPEDEMSIIEAAADMEIDEACKKEACKKEACKKESTKGKVCEKCGKPIEQCECSK